MRLNANFENRKSKVSSHVLLSKLCTQKVKLLGQVHLDLVQKVEGMH